MRTWMYHPSRAPDGQIFDSGEVSLEMLEADGWVDDPAKFGHSPTGQADQSYLQRAKARHERGERISPAGEPSYAELKAELDRVNEQANRRADEINALRTQLDANEAQRLAEQKAQDEAADAVRGSRRAKKPRKAPEGADSGEV